MTKQIKYGMFTKILSWLLLTSIISLISACGGGDGASPVNTVQYSTQLSSEEVIPPVGSQSSGSATFSYDMDSGVVTGQVNLIDAVDVLNVHLHVGALGTTGGVAITLEQDSDDPNRYNVPTNFTFQTSGDLNAFLAEDSYIQVHTDANPGGELRGQMLVANSDFTRYVVPLSNLEAVPANESNGEATAVLIVNEVTGAIGGGFYATNLTGEPGNAHIHLGIPGEDDGTAITFTQNNLDQNSYYIEAGAELEVAHLERFLQAETYINLHSSTFGGGELRGQIIPEGSDLIRYRIALSGDETVPVAVTDAMGFAVILVNSSPDDRSIYGAVEFSNFMGVPGMGHIHIGAVGLTGGTAVTLNRINKSNLYAVPVGEQLIEADLSSMLNGLTYVNLHSDLFPAGEVRGQLLLEP